MFHITRGPGVNKPILIAFHIISVETGKEREVQKPWFSGKGSSLSRVTKQRKKTNLRRGGQLLVVVVHILSSSLFFGDFLSFQVSKCLSKMANFL